MNTSTATQRQSLLQLQTCARYWADMAGPSATIFPISPVKHQAKTSSQGMQHMKQLHRAEQDMQC